MVKWWENRLPKAVQGVTVNTSFLRDRCIRLGVSDARIKLVPNGFDSERFKLPTVDEIEFVRHRWGLANRQVVLYLGSLSFANHPILLLLDAFEQVRHHIPSATLLLVGGGEDYDRIKKEILTRGLGDGVIMTGRVDPATVASIYAASYLVVDPVLDDDAARARSPLKIVESLAMGIPVVTGDVGDRAAMLDKGRAGILVKPGSADALADGIVYAINNQAQYESMAKQAREVSEPYRWEHLAQEFIKVYTI
jgi:glycosyltransferase involved in cell wall biosynthesis